MLEQIQANKTKDEFLMTLSHELRTPLTPILGWTKLLLQRDVDPSRARSAIQTIDRSAQLQARLIDDLLDLARITAGKLSMDLSDIDLLADRGRRGRGCHSCHEGKTPDARIQP